MHIHKKTVSNGQRAHRQAFTVETIKSWLANTSFLLQTLYWSLRLWPCAWGNEDEQNIIYGTSNIGMDLKNEILLMKHEPIIYSFDNHAA